MCRGDGGCREGIFPRARVKNFHPLGLPVVLVVCSGSGAGGGADEMKEEEEVSQEGGGEWGGRRCPPPPATHGLSAGPGGRSRSRPNTITVQYTPACWGGLRHWCPTGGTSTASGTAESSRWYLVLVKFKSYEKKGI